MSSWLAASLCLCIGSYKGITSSCGTEFLAGGVSLSRSEMGNCHGRVVGAQFRKGAVRSAARCSRDQPARTNLCCGETNQMSKT